METKKSAIWGKVIQLLITVLTALATTFGASKPNTWQKRASSGAPPPLSIPASALTNLTKGKEIALRGAISFPLAFFKEGESS